MDWERATKLLGESLDRKQVKERKGGGGKMLSYIEGWHAIAEANRIFGHDGWNRETVEMWLLGQPYQIDATDRNGKVVGQNWVVNYGARVRICVGNVHRDGSGFGRGIDRDFGGAHESALKEAETDATKRALMTFGWPFGLALYDKTQEHVSDGETPQPPVSKAQSKRGWAILVPEMTAQKSPAELNKWWFDHADEITSLEKGHSWLLFAKMIQRGVDMCDKKLSVELFWSNHQTALNKLKKYDQYEYEALEEYMMTKAAKLGAELVSAG